MDRDAQVTLHRTKDASSEPRLVEQGTAMAMIEHIYNQPRISRSEHTINDGDIDYLPSEIEGFARKFGLMEDIASEAEQEIGVTA